MTPELDPSLEKRLPSTSLLELEQQLRSYHVFLKLVPIFYVLVILPCSYCFLQLWLATQHPLIFWQAAVSTLWILIQITSAGSLHKGHIQLGSSVLLCFLSVAPVGPSSPFISSIIAVPLWALRFITSTQYFWTFIAACGYVSFYFIPPWYSVHIYDPYESELRLCSHIGTILFVLIETIAFKAEIMIQLCEAEKKRLVAEDYGATKAERLSIIAHEMRTPLFNILGWTEILEGQSCSNDIKANLTYIKQSGEDLRTQINDTLDMSKIEAGEIWFNCEKMDLRQCIKKASDSFPVLKIDQSYGQFEEKEAIGDEQRIRQCLNNFISNAAKYSHSKGLLIRAQARSYNSKTACEILSHEIEPDPTITYFTQEQLVEFQQRKRLISSCLEKPGPRENSVLFMVEIYDDGPGISNANLKKIFEPYFQIKDQVTKTRLGTGLGLYITFELIQLMKGSISVSSIPGVGSIFCFAVPLSLSQSREQLFKKQIEFTPPKNPILVVEDNRLNLQLVNSFLQRMDCTVITATNGRDALEILKSQEIGLVIMDNKMPVMTGSDCFLKMKELRLNVPFILMTGSDETTRSWFRKIGMKKVLMKPFSQEKLKRAMAKTLSVKSSGALEAPNSKKLKIS